MVKSRDGCPRLCIDFRRLNKVIVKDHFPLPLIDDQLNGLQDGKISQTTDLKIGVSYVPVSEPSQITHPLSLKEDNISF